MWKCVCVVLALLSGAATAADLAREAWSQTLEQAAFTREGLGRLYNPQYQYSCIGLGGTTMRVGPHGFTRPGAPRIMPGGYLQHLPYLAYEYWWDEDAHRHLPFLLTGGYGEALEPGQVTEFRERLDIQTGLLTLELGLRTGLQWEGLYEIGRHAFTSVRELFVTPDGVLVIRVTDAPGSKLPFHLQLDTNQDVRIYLNQGIYAGPHAPWEGTHEARPEGMVCTATRPDSCVATLAVAVAAPDITIDTDARRLGAPATSGITYFIAPGSSYAGPDPQETAWRKANAAWKKGFDALREETAAWWRAFYGRSAVALPDAELARWFARSLYYHGVFFGETHIPPGCNGTSIESFAGAVCPEYDLTFNQFALLYTNHLDEARGVADWILDVLPRARRHAREGLTSHKVTVQYDEGAKYGTLMGYDGAVLTPPTEGEGVNAYSNYPGANAAAMALAYADWDVESGFAAHANEVLIETTRVSLADQQWREDLQAYADRHASGVVQQSAAIHGLNASLARGLAEPDWEALRGRLLLPTASFQGNTVITAGPGSKPFKGYGDAPWLIGLWWYGDLSADDPRVRATYGMISDSFTGKYIFNNAWMGVYAAKLRRADDALAWAKRMIQPGVTLFDDTCFGEIVFGPEDFKKTPEIAAHGALLCNLTQMLLDGDGAREIGVFPTVRDAWRESGVAFDNLMARGGMSVSARTRSGATTVKILNTATTPITRDIVIYMSPEGGRPTGTPGDAEFADGRLRLRDVMLPGGKTTTWRFQTPQEESP